MIDPQELAAAARRHGRVARVLLAEVRGSTPREPGAEMLVWEGGQQGSIGGGRLEFEAVAEARARLAEMPPPGVRRQPLGPALKQCCGGAATIVTEVLDSDGAAALAGEIGDRRVRLLALKGAGEVPGALARRAARHEAPDAPPIPLTLAKGWLAEPVAPPRQALVIYGAGHVGQAIARVVAPLPGFALTLADARPEWLEQAPEAVRRATDPVAALEAAPDAAAHLILTHDHELDLALCDRLLRREFASAGLIGSKTKWARFRKRLAALGHPAGRIARIRCPIGDPALGKHPQAIAVSVAAALLSEAREPGRNGGTGS